MTRCLPASILLFTMGLLASLASLPVPASSAEVTTSGYGQTRQQALSDAQRAAVEQGLGVILESQTVVQDFVVQSDRLTTISSGVVKSSRVLSEKQSPDGLWEVVIKAEVDSDKLQGNINLLLRQLGSPTSMVIVDPGATSNAEFARSVHRQLNSALVAEGFDVINRDVSDQVRQDMGAAMNLDGRIRTAAQVALKYNADVAWLVQATDREGELSYGIRDSIVDVGVQVVAAGNGQVFADTDMSVHGIDPADAARKAGQAISTTLMNQVRVKFADLAQQGASFSVRLWGISSYRDARRFRELLENLPGAAGVKQNAIAIEDDAPSFVDITLTFRGTVDELVDAVFDHATDDAFATLDLKLQRSTQIEFTL